MPATAHSGGLLAGVAVGCDLGGGAQVLSLQIAWVWRAIQARYRPYQLQQPLFKLNQFSSLVKMLGSVCGRPLTLKFPIQKHTVRWATVAAGVASPAVPRRRRRTGRAS